jgi:hypothetical protein
MLSRLLRAGGYLVLVTALALGASVLPPSAAGVDAACPAPPIGPPTTTPGGGAGFVAITPVRVLDTRNAIGAPAAPVEAGCVVRVDLDAANPPPGATAAVLTITSARAPRTTFLTAYGCAGLRPDVSHLNPRRDDPVPGLAVIPIDSTRDVCIYADDTTDVIADITGWYAPGGDPLHEITPVRVLDTRTAPRPAGLPPGRPAAGAVVRVPLAGTILPDAAAAVSVVVTVTNAALPTFATAYPCSATLPPTSTVNTLPGTDRGAPAIVGLDDTGALCVFTEQAADLIVDVTGWFGRDPAHGALPLVVPGSPMRELVAKRLADSRSAMTWTTRFATDEVRQLDVLDHVAIGATAVQLEIIATDALDPGYLTVYPCGTAPPDTSVVNFRPGGRPESSLVTVGLGPSGEVCVRAFGRTHVVVDLVAVHGTSSALRAIGTAPGLDREPVAGQPDHSVHCPAGGSVQLAVVAAPGATVSVAGGSAATRVDTTVTMAVDGLTAIDTAARSGSQRTWVRCLPADFPRLTARGVSPTPGWYRAANFSPRSAPFAFILDEYGVPVWYKRTPYPVIGLFADSTGVAWRNWTGGGFPVEQPPVGLERRALDGTLVDEIELPGEAVGWHEYLVLPNGNRIVVLYTRRTLTGSPRSCIDAATGAPRTSTLAIDGDIVELNPGGNEIWRWETEDHIDESETTQPICFDVDPSPTTATWGLDLVHINAVDHLADGDLVVTARHLDAVFRIDRGGTGDPIAWKLGGENPAEGTHLTLVGDLRGGPRGPHDGRILANGNLLVHDNHIGAADNTSRVAEYSISASAATLVWSRDATIASGTLGSARRLADGTTVIGWGTGTSPWFEQVTADGRRLLTIDVSPGVNIYRAEPSPLAAFDRATLRARAGGSAPPA